MHRSKRLRQQLVDVPVKQGLFAEAEELARIVVDEPNRAQSVALAGCDAIVGAAVHVCQRAMHSSGCRAGRIGVARVVNLNRPHVQIVMTPIESLLMSKSIVCMIDTRPISLAVCCGIIQQRSIVNLYQCVQ